jgi:hypothetical protein
MAAPLCDEGEHLSWGYFPGESWLKWPSVMKKGSLEEISKSV